MRTQEVVRVCAVLVLAGGCQALPVSSPLYVSQLDARHVVRSHTAAADGMVVRAYQQGLRGVLGSECKQYPSDSDYALRASRRCGAVRGTFLSAARFLKEEDNHLLGKPRIYHPERLIHADLDPSCSF